MAKPTKPSPCPAPQDTAPAALRYLVGDTPILRDGQLYASGSSIDLSAAQAARLGLAAVLPADLQLIPLDRVTSHEN